MFTHLHVHTEFSLLDGLSRIDELVRRAKELGMDSLAITDHGGLYGAIDFYRAAKSAGVKPIIGCEMYMAPASRHSKGKEDKNPYHMTVLARDARGYQNLLKLVSKSHLEGFYYRPRIDKELLQQYHEGLIVLSGCPSGEVPTLITQGQMDKARTAALWYRELLGDGYFFELMSHGDVAEQPTINRGLMELHRELGIPVVATNDSHYTNQGDAYYQDILICIQTNTNINDEKRLRMAEPSYYLKSPQEMQALFAEVPEAISNTQHVAEMCNLELDFSRLRLPQYKLPDGMTADDYLAKLCWEGLERRIPNAASAERERLAYELEVIKKTRFANYFLVVWDIARFVRERDIFFAVRGSAAASLALYCLGVTNVNPLHYRLVFERFLNVERKEMPDIDMDFQDDRREEVINYVVGKYGPDHVAQIITFGTLGARASIRDVGRALGKPYAEVDRVARLIPFKLHITLDEAMQLNPELKEIYEADQEVRKLVDTARSLEGLTRHASTHAAGVVISEEPLDEVAPLQRPTRGDEAAEGGVAMTQYAMEPCAALGLLKMDFLGLANLTILARTRELVARTRGIEIKLLDIPLDDRKAFELLSRGDTAGVFQLEGGGMTRYIKELKPSSLGDVAAMIALYRPGPMEHIGTFINAKHGRVAPHYPHPALKDILEETYGVIVFQDQVLHIFRTFAGYSLGEADIVRKAMGKKIPEIMAKERERFIQGAIKEGYTQELAEELFTLIEPFAGYAFNKAHSVSYGLISYWTAYLKANYPAEYMASLMNCYIDSAEKIANAVAECRRMQIPVLLPDINRSEQEFSIEDTGDGPAIRFGLAAVKNVGTGAIRPLLEARAREGPFNSIEHMCRVADMSGLNRKALESLIKAGAFDSFGDRGALLAAVEKILSLAQSEARLRGSNQSSMFDLFRETVPAPLVRLELANVQTSERERCDMEKELLGVALSNNNLFSSLARVADSDAVVFRSMIEPEMAGKRLVIAGVVSLLTRRYTREQKPFTIATLELMDGPVEVFVWEDVQAATEGLWAEGKLLRVVGTVRVREDQISISCNEASELIVPETAQALISANDEVHNVVENLSNMGQGPGVRDQVATTASPSLTSGPPSLTPSSNGSVQTPPQVAAGAPKRLNLRIRESGHPENDEILMDDVKRLLLEYLGEDEVKLEIATEGHIVTLEWPMVKVNACPELEQQLRQLLGPAGSISIQGALF